MTGSQNPAQTAMQAIDGSVSSQRESQASVLQRSESAQSESATQ